jgi:hypothetical protein
MSAGMNYEKPSREGQWHERSERPIAARPMTKAEIEEHRHNLVLSYGCDDADITFDFQKITNENDEDRDDCILLIYKMRCVVNNKPRVREIFSIKLPIPEELRRSAEALRRQAAKAPAQKKPLRALPAPTRPVVEGVVVDGTLEHKHPVLRRPTRGKK